MADANAAAPAKAAAPKKAKKAGPYKPASKFCPKCGARMAAHADRFACGRCNYTEWKSAGGKGK
ncbi:MAG: 30S ribosomal protein S27ae [Candidatus Micrarchaeota archaeon]|nr:30S ribosomal protein S27ae [Candidatus Micrarchaeota archaeon]